MVAILQSVNIWLQIWSSHYCTCHFKRIAFNVNNKDSQKAKCSFPLFHYESFWWMSQTSSFFSSCTSLLGAWVVNDYVDLEDARVCVNCELKKMWRVVPGSSRPHPPQEFGFHARREFLAFIKTGAMPLTIVLSLTQSVKLDVFRVNLETWMSLLFVEK